MKEPIMDEKAEAENWHSQDMEARTYGDRLADTVARQMGSWRFIVLQTILVIVWMSLNLLAYSRHWDTYPFILLNLLFSIQAAYTAPIIMMVQNRQGERDRMQADADYRTNIEAKQEIENLQIKLDSIEAEKLDKAIRLLEYISTQMEKRY
ncbi:DUF1003 domain-containing protein [Mucilaginibacter aquaedulcis]|uniref:DUF1003 domain-containing protein n=1 Tax=Mucilaginibacter aquaedulcis TaxID=1187081 RepID=UPI0025B56F7C|nr:DUF1003 domain-containing protein [Mucilaginibacter aquaedulcis]MDN3546760.1 DUF1003 domain-containing protein [Mucilaginibacter aquaedulcis]